jgi:hypothetical protein
MAGVPRDQLAAGENAIIIREGRVGPNVLYGGLFVVVVLALVRGLTGAQTAAGRVAVAVVFGALTALTAWLWVTMIRRRGHLEVTSQAITYSDGNRPPLTLSRQQGDVLSVVATGSVRFRTRSLTAQGTSTRIPMAFFKLSQVRQACTAMGWQVQPGQGPKGWSQPKSIR